MRNEQVNAAFRTMLNEASKDVPDDMALAAASRVWHGVTATQAANERDDATAQATDEANSGAETYRAWLREEMSSVGGEARAVELIVFLTRAQQPGDPQCQHAAADTMCGFFRADFIAWRAEQIMEGL